MERDHNCPSCYSNSCLCDTTNIDQATTSQSSPGFSIYSTTLPAVPSSRMPHQDSSRRPSMEALARTPQQPQRLTESALETLQNQLQPLTDSEVNSLSRRTGHTTGVITLAYNPRAGGRRPDSHGSRRPRLNSISTASTTEYFSAVRDQDSEAAAAGEDLSQQPDTDGNPLDLVRIAARTDSRADDPESSESSERSYN